MSEEEEIMEVINIISPIRLIEGGAAILHDERRNHQVAIGGKSIRIPLVIYILREFMAS